MAVPGNAPADLAATELFAVDAYATEFDARVAEVDPRTAASVSTARRSTPAAVVSPTTSAPSRRRPAR